jgi:NAD(P)-dependent dehydrogenase (short-subunit alcohol dehydrogenase family)
MGDRLAGKVAIVTGSTLGIGAATARLFAQHGARVVLDSHREDEAAQGIRCCPASASARPEELAYTALFLASDEACFINAADILVDGGRSQLYHE